MPTTICQHKEKIETGKGFEIGTCQLCGQVRRYNTQNRHEEPRVIKPGRINGMVVLPGPQVLMELSAEKAGELQAVISASSKRPQSPSDSKASQGDRVAGAVPPRPKKRSRLPQYFEDNKAAILEDYRQLTLQQFFARWHITSATWAKLRMIWNVPGKKEELKKAKARLGRGLGSPSIDWMVAALNKQRIDWLPPFPAFNDNWTSSVQEKWFETYKALKAMAPVR